jgi:hypothetical protein
MAARQPECALLYRQPGSLPAETMVLPADVLTDIEGKAGLVTLVATGDGQGEARWDDGGVPRRRPFVTVLPAKLPRLPELPANWQPVEPAFLLALAEAARTTARDGVRYALARIQFRGRSGQLVATDGRQLLVQGGFALPWSEDVLIPALPLFVSRDLPREGPIALGRTATHVGLRIGPWTFPLEIDTSGRYPNTERVIPRGDGLASRLRLSEDDACFLAHVLPRLPGSKDDLAPVTLELGEQVVLRARPDDAPQVTEVLLSGSSCAGPAVRVACNRRFLWRLVQLGFREVLVRNATTPLLCRDETRTYLFMPLEGAMPSAPDATRIISGESMPIAHRAKPKPEPERSQAIMPRPQTNGEEPRNGPARVPAPVPAASEAEPPDPLVEAEALRALLHDAQLRLNRLLSALKQQRRHSRAPARRGGLAAPAAPGPLTPFSLFILELEIVDELGFIADAAPARPAGPPSGPFTTKSRRGGRAGAPGRGQRRRPHDG